MALPLRAGLFLVLSGLPGWVGFRPAAWVSATLVLALSWAFSRLEGRGWASLGLSLDGRWGKDLLLGLGLGMGLIGLAALGVRACNGFHWEPNSAFQGVLLWQSAVTFCFVAIHEECLFRGYPFQRLVEALGAWPAQVILGLLFALAHWGNPGMAGLSRPLATLNILLAALLLGLCYLRTRSLALPMGLHLGWNWAQGSLLGFPVSGITFAQGPWRRQLHGGPAWLTGGAFGLEASLMCTLVCLGAIGALGFWKGRGR